jgi:two-component system CheB/CheR fusion protein
VSDRGAKTARQVRKSGEEISVPWDSHDEAKPSYVIVVGGSAGGLDALTAMLGAVEVGLGWCVVIAQHTAPTGTSELAHLLDRASALHVVEAADGDDLRPDTVFVAPPGHDIAVRERSISIDVPDLNTRPWPSIDRLFVSAAQAFGDRSVAVVLSGTGSDGASGVEAVESAGGVVAVQERATAAFDSMPSASFATGSVDIEEAAADIPGALERFLRGTPPDSPPSEVIGTGVVDDVVAALYEQSGLDFSGYKTSTLQRQIIRRQRLSAIAETALYLQHLRQSPTEASALARALLVTVTAFFRDQGVWNGLREHLDAVVSASEGGQVRMWVPGCATGQEAYTLAVLVAEALAVPDVELPQRLKIFATDLDERALTIARVGRYPIGERNALPEYARVRWTRDLEGEFEISPVLRECIVFARHNVAFDPPFPDLNMISLRNTLIYFQPRLQERALQLCQFALNPGGLLLLGQSERVPRTDDAFVSVDAERRLYRRRQSPRALGLPLSGIGHPVRGAKVVDRGDVSPRSTAVGDHFYSDIVKAVAPSALIVDDRAVLVEVIGDVTPWVAVSEGVHSGHVVDLVKDDYRAAVRAMLSQLRFSAPRTVTRSIRSDRESVRISVTRIDTAEGRSGAGAIIAFQAEAEAEADSDSRPENTPDADVDAPPVEVRVELDTVYDALQATVEDLSASNEELQALNEELQASSEELQASSEEVQASNEELEATNEELVTLNQELAVRGAELTRANTDLENIQSSLTNGLVLLDRDLRVTRYTALAVRLFSLIPSDVGRELSAIPTTIAMPGLTDLLLQTLAGDSRILESGGDGRDLLVQTQPYRGDHEEILGVIVVVIDVTDITAERRARERALANLEVITDSVRETVWQRDSSGALTLLTRRVEEMYGLDRARVLADPSLLLIAVHPADRDRVAAVSASASPDWQLRYRIVRPDGTVRWIDESAARIQPPDGSPPLRVGTALDVTEQHELTEQLERRTELVSAMFDSSSLGLLLVDSDGRIERSSPAIEAMTGHSADALTGRTVLSVLPPDDRALDDDDTQSRRVLHADGHSTPATIEILRRAGNGRTVVVVHDSSRLRHLSAELAAREQFDHQTGLLNRAFFRAQAMEMVTAEGAASAVLWIDLDGFKEVNDRLGHRNGDLVLGVIATRLQRAARTDQLVGRFGGDEFAMLVTGGDDLDTLDGLVHRVLAAVREPVVIDDVTAFVSASIGVAVQPVDGTTVDDLLHNADVAMYSAKQNGRDRAVYFTAEMDHDADVRATIRHQLASAVRAHEFELHYQPIRSISTGATVMVEALMRWRRDGELVTASEFITLATETGQLRALGHLALDCLIDDVAALYRQFGVDHPRVAFNLSVTELRERELMDRLLSWRPDAGFDRIVIEVTEHVTLIPGDRAFGALTLLQRLGATISIDDFGTGYSNLELLGRLRPGIIKIDRTLTERAAEDVRGERILDAAVRLAHALEATAVIEGVGDARLSAVAAATGAELAQGYYHGHPMPLLDLIETIRDGG